jgi:hypothetical protein
VTVSCPAATAPGGGRCSLVVREGFRSRSASYAPLQVELALHELHTDDDDDGGFVEVRGLEPGFERVSIYRDLAAAQRWTQEHAALRSGSLQGPLEVHYGNVWFILGLWVPCGLVLAALNLAWGLGKSGTDLFVTFDAGRGELRMRYQRPLRRRLETAYPLVLVSVRYEPGDDETRPSVQIMTPRKGWTVVATGSQDELKSLAERIGQLVKMARVDAPPGPVGPRVAAR